MQTCYCKIVRRQLPTPLDVADIILKNDCWAGTVLFGANACLQFYKIDVSALELPIRFQMRTSILICKSPPHFRQWAFAQFMVVIDFRDSIASLRANENRIQRGMTT